MTLTKGTDITQGLPLPHLLGLTPQIRHGIYLYLDLVSWRGPRVFDLNSKPNLVENEESFYGLLVSCRTLYNEFSALLYSGHHFTIRYSDQGSLQPLRDLSDTSLAHLTSLKIVLNEFSCHSTEQNSAGFCCLDDNDCYHILYLPSHEHHRSFDRHVKATRGSTPWTNRMLQEWQLTAEHLSSRIVPAKLDLSVVFDVFDEEDSTVAHRAVAPISFLSPLKNCHIRLGLRPVPEIQHIAQHAVLKAKGILREAGPKPSPVLAPSELKPSKSHLLCLPRELRFRILEYTDLITPWREVIWSRQSHGYIASVTECWDHEVRSIPDIHHGCQFRRCFRSRPAASKGCFCRLRHTAFSSGCNCWAPPTDLFLICRAMHADAQVVFFSSNRFVVHDLDHNEPYNAPEGCKYPNEIFAASQFLREVVPSNGLRQLRFLELVSPPYDSIGWPPDGHRALQEWAETIEWLRPQIHAPGLTVRVVMAESDPWTTPDKRERMSKAAGSVILDAYNRIAMTFTPLVSDHLRGFYAQFTCPWARTYPHITITWKKEEELNERVERMIMGERYDEMVRRHDRPSSSMWPDRFLRVA